MENFAQFLRAKTLEIGGIVVDSSQRNIRDTAQEIKTLILDYLKEDL